MAPASEVIRVDASPLFDRDSTAYDKEYNAGMSSKVFNNKTIAKKETIFYIYNSQRFFLSNISAMVLLQLFLLM